MNEINGSISKRVLRKFKADVEAAKNPVTTLDLLHTYDDLEGAIQGDYDAYEVLRDTQKFIVAMYTFFGAHDYTVTIEPDDETETLHWIYVEDGPPVWAGGPNDHHCECPKCHMDAPSGTSFFDMETPYCPFCGTELLPSGEIDQDNE